MTTITLARPVLSKSYWFQAAGGVALGLLLGLVGVGLIATQFFGWRIATIQSGSMEPSLHRGDLVISRPTQLSTLRTGDVILFEQGTGTRILIAHRIANVLEFNTTIHNERTGEDTKSVSRLFRTRGDANVEPDADLVGQDAIQGRIILTIPSVGLVFNKFPLQYCLLALSGASALCWAGFELRRLLHRNVEA